MTKSIVYTTYHQLKKQKENRNKRDELPTPEPRNLSAITQPVPTQNTQVTSKKPTDKQVQKVEQKPVQKPVKVSSNDELIRQLRKEINDQKLVINQQNQLIADLRSQHPRKSKSYCNFCGKEYSSKNPRVRFRTCGHYLCNNCVNK